MCPSRRQHRSLANKELAESETVLALVHSCKILASAKGKIQTYLLAALGKRPFGTTQNSSHKAHLKGCTARRQFFNQLNPNCGAKRVPNVARNANGPWVHHLSKVSKEFAVLETARKVLAFPRRRTF